MYVLEADGLLTLPTSVCAFASVRGPTVSSACPVLKETLGRALRGGIYTERHPAL